jgi:hypothetical protein
MASAQRSCVDTIVKRTVVDREAISADGDLASAMTRWTA